MESLIQIFSKHIDFVSKIVFPSLFILLWRRSCLCKKQYILHLFVVYTFIFSVQVIHFFSKALFTRFSKVTGKPGHEDEYCWGRMKVDKIQKLNRKLHDVCKSMRSVTAYNSLLYRLLCLLIIDGRRQPRLLFHIR